MRTVLKSVAAGLAGLVLSATSHAGTVWMPTDQNVNFVSITGGMLGLFDDSDSSFTKPLIVETFDAVGISPTTGGFLATLIGTANSVLLTDTDHFVLGMRQDGTSPWFGDSGTPILLGPNTYQVVFDAIGTTIQIDASPVPLPPAALLFGSAVIGLAAMGRRRARERLSAAV